MRKSFILIGSIITTLGIAFSPVSSKASGNVQVNPKSCSNVQIRILQGTPRNSSDSCLSSDGCNTPYGCMNSSSCGSLNQFLQEYLAKNYPNLACYFGKACPKQEACANPTDHSCGSEESPTISEETTSIPEEFVSVPDEVITIPAESPTIPDGATGNHDAPADKPDDTGLATNDTNENAAPSVSTPSNNEVAEPATYEEQVVALVNAERAKEGLPALKVDETLQAAALARAKETVQLFSHTRPNGTSCFTILKEYGISYRYAGENIAYGQRSPEEVVSAWMNSAGHRANIMSENFTTIGIGYYQTANGTKYWSQLFLS